MIEIKDLDCPKDVKDTYEKESKRAERLLKSRNLKLSKDDFSDLQKIIKKRLKIAKKETEPLRRRLTRWNELMEGIVSETNFPFEGASNITLRYAMGLARTFEAKFNKTLYGDEELFTPDVQPDVAKELKLDDKAMQVLQDGFNYSFSKEFNGLNALKPGTIPGFRDGTFLIEGAWERKVESVSDQRTYRDLASFQKDYPDAKSSGAGDDGYQDIIDYFLTDEEPELVVRFKYDMVLFEGPEYKQIHRAKFLIYPTIAKKISDATLYGCGFEKPKEEVEAKSKKGEYYEAQVKQALSKNGQQNLDSWDKARLFVEGHSTPEPDNAPVQLYDLVVLWDKKGDGAPGRYRVVVISNGDDVFVVSCRPYDLRHNVPSIVPFRLAGRDGSFEGYSMVGDGEDLFNQVDTLFRHDNNVMMLTTSPIFVAQETLKEQIDLGRAENIIRPGVTYWVPDITKAMKQLEVADVAAASGDNNVKMSIISRFLEMLVGVSVGESGQQSPDDPNAPARKTTLLLMQSSQRIDQCIESWCQSIPDLGLLHATLLYQFSGGTKYDFKDKKGMPQSFPIQILGDRRLKWIARRRSMALTPEYAMARIQGLVQAYAGMRPLLMQGDPIILEMWNRMVKNSGEPECDKLLMDPNQAPQIAQMAVQKAMQQFMMKAKLDASAKGQVKLAQESAKEVVKVLGEQAREQASGAQQLLTQDQPGGVNAAR